VRAGTEDGTYGDVEVKVRREGEDQSQLATGDVFFDICADRRGYGDALTPRLDLDLLEVRVKFDWDQGRDCLRDVTNIVYYRNAWSRVKASERERERERFISPKGRVWKALRAIPGR